MSTLKTTTNTLATTKADKPVRLFVIGSVNLDFVVTTERLPAAGETVMGGSFTTTPGGKGANQALAARRLGADVSFCACVGNDAYADEALANLAAEGVDLVGVTRLDASPTGAAFISVSADGENQITVASGANLDLAPEHVPVIHGQVDAVLAQLETPQDATLAAGEGSDVFFALNAAPMRPLLPALLDRTDLLIINEGERDQLLGEMPDAMDRFSGLIAVTLGAAGAVLIRDGHEISRATPPNVDVVDTTGAGDCFCAALTVGLSAGLERGDALRRACVAGALSTTRLGAQTALPTSCEVEKLA